MADLGAEYTDAAVKEVEKQLKSVYNAAYRDILQKQKDFNAAYARKEAKYQAQLKAGKITQEQFDNWKKGQVFQGKQWEAKKKQILNTLYASNEIATKIVNGQATNVFAFNANYQSFDLEHGVGVDFGFGLYDSATVANLIKNDPKLLPEWKIDQPKDYRWNQKKLNKEISLGIIEGESLDQIAKRLCDKLSTQNFNHMRTFARTAMTCAQNAGREMSLQAAADKGIKLKKEWMCTLDGHTRTNHRLLDGQKQPLNKPFEVEGMKIRYPGDPTAHPSMVYNCRCTMVGDVEDYPATYDRYDNIDGKPIKNMTYEEWAKAKAAGTNIKPVPLTYSHKIPKPSSAAKARKATRVILGRNYLEKEISDDVFNECAQNSAYRRQQMIDNLSGASNDYKRCFTGTLSQITYEKPPEGKGAFYRDSDRGIRVDLDKVFKRDGNLGTLFHETGHAMDYYYGRLMRGPNASATKMFRDAVKRDIENLAKFVNTPEGARFVRDMLDNDSSKGAQDFFSAFKPLNDQGPLKGKIPPELRRLRYFWGHDYDYYCRHWDPMKDAASELFANISHITGDPNAEKYMKTLFPESCGAFNKIMKKMAKALK